MNKKFSTLVAVLLAAGAWTTLDAKVITVTEPAVGQAVVIGSNLDGAKEGSAIYLTAEGYAAVVEGDVTAETTTWELEAVPAVESKSEASVKYYLKTKNSDGETVYLLQAQGGEGEAEGASLKSTPSYTYSVGAVAEGQAALEIYIVDGRIQVMEGETAKNLKFGESKIESEEIQTKRDRKSTRLNSSH